MKMLRTLTFATTMFSICSPGVARAQLPSLELRPLVQAVDTNHDGCISHQEWLAAGLPESSYQGLKDKDGCVTLARMQAEPAPPGIDLDGDGKLTVDEFREFDKKFSALQKAPPQQPPAPGH